VTLTPAVVPGDQPKLKHRRGKRRKTAIRFDAFQPDMLEEGEEGEESEGERDDETLDNDQASKRSRRSDDEDASSRQEFRTVFNSMNYVRNNDKLSKAGITIPPFPAVDSPCLCLKNWVFSSNYGTEETTDCTDSKCNRVHRTDLKPGMISYESIRYQIAHFFCAKPPRVADLLTLVEEESVFFLPEEKS
jgi:hypothetical protein